MMKPGGSIAMPEMPTQANQTQQPVWQSTNRFLRD
jgi:hypothetical protein